MENKFLIQLDSEANFLTQIRDGRPFGSPFPNYASQMSFDAADEISRKLRDDGYSFATVVDRFGQPLTAADLVAVKRSVEYRVVFSGFYFAGVNEHGREIGSRDPDKAQSMSQEAAIKISQKLKRAGHLDSTLIEVSSSANVDDELERLWPGWKTAEK